jgi:hypothetical protein
MKRKKIYPMAVICLLFLSSIFSYASGDLEGSIFFSTEEDFISGVAQEDGNPIISDGDLLNSLGMVYMRNYELLNNFQVEYDLGLDAVDVINTEERLVAFSTELAHPDGLFTEGDLLITNGAILPNAALLVNFNIPLSLNLGLDAVQFIGRYDSIIDFLNEVADIGADEWKENPNLLIEFLNQYDIDIWFSTEGTAPFPDQPLFLDGDLLSASQGIIVASNDMLLHPAVPAGIPHRGVDFGLDAVMMEKREPAPDLIHYSTEILYNSDNLSFTDGDILLLGNGIVIPHTDLIPGFEPRANFLGLDALAFYIPPPGPDIVVDYQPTDWGTGFSCAITITNNSGAPVVGWTLEFDFTGNQTIDNFWSCMITQTGQHVQIDNASWNETIGNGGSVTIGFIATYSGLNETPALFLFNGVPANQ